jgi:hypothetical protein
MQVFKTYKEFTAVCPACDARLTHNNYPCTNCKRANLKLIFRKQDDYRFRCPHCEWENAYLYCAKCNAQIDEKFINWALCFVATAVFGHDSRVTESLRVFRDKVLLKLPGGHAFVFWYYKWSPRMLRWMGKDVDAM